MEFSCDSTRFGKHYCTMLLSMYKAALTPWPYVGVVNQSWSLYILKSLPKQWLMIHTQQTFPNLVCTLSSFYYLDGILTQLSSVCVALCAVLCVFWCYVCGLVVCCVGMWCGVLCCVVCAVLWCFSASPVVAVMRQCPHADNLSSCRVMVAVFKQLGNDIGTYCAQTMFSTSCCILCAEYQQDQTSISDYFHRHLPNKK